MKHDTAWFETALAAVRKFLTDGETILYIYEGDGTTVARTILVYPAQQQMQTVIRQICNRIYLSNATQSARECFHAACLLLCERAEEFIGLPEDKRWEFVKKVCRSATFKVLRWIPEWQPQPAPDEESAEPDMATPQTHKECGRNTVEDTAVDAIDPPVADPTPGRRARKILTTVRAVSSFAAGHCNFQR